MGIYTDWVGRNRDLLRNVLIGLLLCNILGYAVAACVAEERRDKISRTERYARENKALAQKLPEGCEIRYIGDWQRVDVTNIPVVVAICKGRATTSTNSIIPSGKSTVPSTSVVIEGQ